MIRFFVAFTEAAGLLVPCTESFLFVQIKWITQKPFIFHFANTRIIELECSWKTHCICHLYSLFLIFFSLDISWIEKFLNFYRIFEEQNMLCVSIYEFYAKDYIRHHQNTLILFSADYSSGFIYSFICFVAYVVFSIVYSFLQVQKKLQFYVHTTDIWMEEQKKRNSKQKRSYKNGQNSTRKNLHFHIRKKEKQSNMFCLFVCVCGV